MMTFIILMMTSSSGQVADLFVSDDHLDDGFAFVLLALFSVIFW